MSRSCASRRPWARGCRDLAYVAKLRNSPRSEISGRESRSATAPRRSRRMRTQGCAGERDRDVRGAMAVQSANSQPWVRGRRDHTTTGPRTSRSCRRHEAPKPAKIRNLGGTVPSHPDQRPQDHRLGSWGSCFSPFSARQTRQSTATPAEKQKSLVGAQHASPNSRRCRA